MIMTLRGHTRGTRPHRRRSLERRAALWPILGSSRRRPARSRPRPCGSSTRATIDVFLAGGDESHTGDRQVFRDTLIWAKDRSSAGKAQGHCTVIDASTEILTIEPRPAQASPPPRWRAEATTACRGQIQVDLDIARAVSTRTPKRIWPPPSDTSICWRDSSRRVRSRPLPSSGHRQNPNRRTWRAPHP